MNSLMPRVLSVMVFSLLYCNSSSLSVPGRTLLSRLPSSSRLSTSVAFEASVPGALTQLSLEQWKSAAEQHGQAVNDLLYPKYVPKKRIRRKLGSSDQQQLWVRSHQVPDHPIYNFLHNYYKYSIEDLRKYSPGMGIVLQGATSSSPSALLDVDSMTFNENGGSYDFRKLYQRLGSQKVLERFVMQRDILAASAARPAFLGCFGMHEWAMLYSGNGSVVKGHQQLPLRVSQEVIDSVVGTPGQLRCTHFDAYRFFQPAAKPLNAVSPLTRPLQQRYEQPGCIHANMDLFRYAYTLYPFISSELLLASLRLAVEARKVDMRASPYDVSGFEGCEEPICVETPQGRKLYVAEQERITALGAPLRRQLCAVYDYVMGSYLAAHGDRHPCSPARAGDKA